MPTPFLSCAGGQSNEHCTAQPTGSRMRGCAPFCLTVGPELLLTGLHHPPSLVAKGMSSGCQQLAL